MTPLPVRPHHGMCLAFFVGEGYSDGFSAHMAQVLLRLEGEDPVVQVVPWTDEICAACPNNENGVCRSVGKVDRYDREVLTRCGLAPGTQLRWSAFSGLVWDRILKPGQRREICGGCQWNALCAKQEELNGSR